jgi:hypothetical protein
MFEGMRCKLWALPMRATLHEIIVRVEGDHIEMILHWQGERHRAEAETEIADRGKR